MDSQYRCHDIVKLLGLARRTGGKEGVVCGKPVEAIQALAQGSMRMETLPKCQNAPLLTGVTRTADESTSFV
jgi:hypothetical protein